MKSHSHQRRRLLLVGVTAGVLMWFAWATADSLTPTQPDMPETTLRPAVVAKADGWNALFKRLQGVDCQPKVFTENGCLLFFRGDLESVESAWHLWKNVVCVEILQAGDRPQPGALTWGRYQFTGDSAFLAQIGKALEIGSSGSPQ